MSDLQDAITYVQTLEEIDENKVGIWGSSFAGGLVLQVAATDKRVKAVISQVRTMAPHYTLFSQDFKNHKMPQ